MSTTIALDDESLPSNPSHSFLSSYCTLILTILSLYIILSTLLTLVIYRVIRVLNRPKPRRTPSNSKDNPHQQKDHLLIVLGSGGHTAEMISILQNLGTEYLNSRFGRRTWVVSSGDGFSAERAREFEARLVNQEGTRKGERNESMAGSSPTTETEPNAQDSRLYDIVTVHRARNIHQSLLTTPLSALRCLWDCILLLRGEHSDQKQKPNHNAAKAGNTPIPYPDLILTNGPATAVILVLASLILLSLGVAPVRGNTGSGAMRTIYIESWARVKTLSLSGKILQRCCGVNRFLVQWKGREDVDLTLEEEQTKQDRDDVRNGKEGRARLEGRGGSGFVIGRKIEYVGTVVT